MLLFYKKTKKKSPKITLEFEPDKNFEAEFSNFVEEVLNCKSQEENQIEDWKKNRKQIRKVKLK